MKIVKWVVIGVVALILIGSLIVYFSLNGIVRRTVQSQSSKQLGVPTTLAGASVSLFSGNVGLEDLKIGNPEGFSDGHIFTLGGTEVDTSLGQLTADPVRIASIQIDRPKLLIEQKDGKFNFKALVDQMPQGPSEPAPDEETLKLIIGHLTVNGAEVLLRPGIPGLTSEITVPLPTIDLENIGTGEGAQNGAALKEVVTQLITTMAAKAAESDQVPAELRQLLSLDVAQVTAMLGTEARKQVDKVVGDLSEKLPPEVGQTLKDAVNNPEQIRKDPGKAAQDALGGLIRKERDQRAPTTTPAR